MKNMFKNISDFMAKHPYKAGFGIGLFIGLIAL
jgi:hypothetical protein